MKNPSDDLKTAPYHNTQLSIEDRAADLLGRMTLEEKATQLRAYLILDDLGLTMEWNPYGVWFYQKRVERIADIHSRDYRRIVGRCGHFSMLTRELPAQDAAQTANRIQKEAVENTRLGIPAMIHDEGLHGLCAHGATSFPQAISLSATWNPALMQQVATVIGQEARSRGIRQLLAPTINIARDTRAGRTEETYGEDPYLTSRMAVAYVKGVQSQGVIATPKHFAANFAGDAGRDSHPVHFSEQFLREVYFPAFKAAVVEGGALSIMAAYNTINGMPCSCDPWLLTDVLKKEWGFKGYVVSDYMSVEMLMLFHHVTADRQEAAKRALEAGMDVELPSPGCYGEDLLNGLKDGSISSAALDDSVRRVLETKMRIGLFDQPYVDEGKVFELNNAPESRSLALQASREAIVLLKNPNGVLPLSGITNLAVIGPLADEINMGAYGWDGYDRSHVVTALAGIRDRANGIGIQYAEGCKVTQSIPGGMAAAANTASRCSAAVVVVGNNNQAEAEGMNRSDLNLPGVQAELVKAVAATGIPTVVVLMNGSPITMSDWFDQVAAVIDAWYPGEEGGNAIADVLFGKYNPGGRLPITFPQRVGQLPLYYNAKTSGRGNWFVDERTRPMFPFGYGLSYTSFEYRSLSITHEKDQTFSIRMELENRGPVAGDEVVQLYVHDVLSTLSRPLKELKGFQRVSLQPKETRQLTFTLAEEDLGYYTAQGKYIVEPGIFEVMLGSSSEDIRLMGNMEV
jgi:beta-glucosidase